MNHAKAIRIRELLDDLIKISLESAQDCKVYASLQAQQYQQARIMNRLTMQMAIQLQMRKIINENMFQVTKMPRGTFREKKK